MELSSENIEELARAMTAPSRSISQQDGVFQTKSDFSAIDVDRVISDAQDSLLNTSMEAIRSCNVPCSFNDILEDICKMNNNMELQQAALNTSIPQLPPDPPAFYHMPDLEIQSEDYTSQCNFSNQNEFLQPLSQWSEYLPLPPSALSSIQDIPQLAPIPTTPPTPTPPPQPVPVVMQKIPDSNEAQAANANPITKEAKQESAAPGTPVQFFNNYHFTIPPAMMHPQSIQQSEVPNCNVQFSQVPETNINFMMFQEQPMGASNIRLQQQQQPFLDWARVIPRRAFLQSEVVVLRPLRTRKVISARPNFDLATYFDTSTISIPMIKERPRCKANRRKQKLYTIPRADNLVFEVQLGPSEEDRDNNNNKEDSQIYPETETPELDEFFKRKRRTLHTRRKPPNQETVKTLSPTLPVEESKDIDDDEDIPSPEKQPESYSDVDSDDAPLTIVKSMKCLNCRKLFKTCRSLTIHSKRCKVVPKSPQKEEQLPEVVKPNQKLTRKATLKNNDNSSQDNANVKKDDPVGRVVTRSLTRLQTRNAAKHKAAEDDGDHAPTPKRSK